MKFILFMVISLVASSYVWSQAAPYVDSNPGGSNSTVRNSYGGWYNDLRSTNAIASPNILWVSVSGSDTNPGSFAFPFQTIQKGSSSASNGWTVAILGGYYPERVTNINPGVTYISAAPSTNPVYWGGIVVKTNNITINGSNVNNLVFTGTNLGTRSGADGVIKLLAGTQNFTIKNFAASNPDAGFGNLGFSIIVSVPSVTNYPAVSNIWISDSIWTNVGYDCAYLLGQNIVVSNIFLSSQNGWDAFRMMADNSIITTCTFSNYDNPGITNPGHCDIWQTFPNNGEHGSNMVFERNIVFNGKDQVQFNFGANQGGTNELIHFVQFRNNIIYNMDGNMGIYIPNFWIYNNTFVHDLVGANTASWGFQMDASHGDGYAGRTWNNLYWVCGVNPASDVNGWYDSYTNQNGSNFTGGINAPFTNDYNMVSGLSNASKRTTAGFWREVHGINGGDPLLDSTNSISGFTPLPGSPLLLAGTNLSSLFPGGVGVDFNGNPRPASGAWTIGAKQ